MEGLMRAISFLIFLTLVCFAPLPLMAQEQSITVEPNQRPGQSTTTTREEKVRPDGTKTTKETSSTESKGTSYKYSGLPGKFIRQGGQSLGQGVMVADRERRQRYGFDFETTGLRKGSDPSEAYWFERQDGKIMLIDPLKTQKYSQKPR
jgi:hypothetical protein